MSIHILTIAPEGVQLPCDGTSSILDVALAAGFFPKHSCRRGDCNSCMVPVQEGQYSYPEGFVAQGVPAGYCLTCMARPKTDVTISAPEVLQTPGRRVVQVGARVTTVDRINDDVAVVQLQVPIASGFGFHAGQYVDVVLRDGTRRSYSMANTPNDLGMIEWHVRAMPKGRFSNHVFNSLKPRDLIRIEGPYGSFRLKASDAPVVLLASGTGYAPIASMMRTHAAELRRRGATLFWGGHKEADLYAMQDALAWQAESDMHRFVPVLSNPDEGWNGATGFVHEAVQRLYPDLSRHEVYACGNPLMVDAARQAFISQNHLDPSLYFSDAFISVLTPSVLTAQA